MQRTGHKCKLMCALIVLCLCLAIGLASFLLYGLVLGYNNEMFIDQTELLRVMIEANFTCYAIGDQVDHDIIIQATNGCIDDCQRSIGSFYVLLLRRNITIPWHSCFPDTTRPLYKMDHSCDRVCPKPGEMIIMISMACGVVLWLGCMVFFVLLADKYWPRVRQTEPYSMN